MKQTSVSAVRLERGIARISAVALATAVLALSAGCASAGSATAAKALGEEPPVEQSLERNAKAPRLEAQLESTVALERYAYTTAKGNVGCPTDLWADRPPFTVGAGVTYEFCLDIGDTKQGDAAEARVDVSYKIVGDAEGRTVRFLAGVDRVGLDELECEVRKADMKTADPAAPYSCEAEWVEGKSTDFPRAWLRLMEAGTPVG